MAMKWEINMKLMCDISKSMITNLQSLKYPDRKMGATLLGINYIDIKYMEKILIHA